MAERRMFAKTIIDSDAFLDMPMTTQLLYFHLSMRADDDGFVNNPRKIQRMIGASDDDLNLLIAKAFIIPFENKVVVIKHWRINNYLRSDRYKETVYTDEKKQLFIKPDGAYTLDSHQGKNALGIPTVDQRDTQDRLGESKELFVKEIKEKIDTACAYAKDLFSFEIELITNALVHGCSTSEETYGGTVYTSETWKKVVETMDEQLISEVVNALHANRPETDGIRYTLGIFANKTRGKYGKP